MPGAMPLIGGDLSGAAVFGWAVGSDVRVCWVDTAGAALGFPVPIHAARSGGAGFVAETLRGARACSTPGELRTAANSGHKHLGTAHDRCRPPRAKAAPS